MLSFPAAAEPNPSSPPANPSAAQAGSTAETAPAQNEPADPADDATPADDAAAAEAKPEGTDQNLDAAAAEPPKSRILIDVDKSTQEMTVFVDGIEQHRWPVSTGMSGYSSPSGTFDVSSMNKIWYSKQWDNAPMPHAIFFTKKGHAIHGTTEVKRLGNAASKGCVRVAPQNAETLFNLVKATGMENTQVVLTGTTKGGEGPKVASPGPSRQYQGYPPPWFGPGNGYYAQPGQRNKKRRGLFGRRWFEPGTQGYYAPRYQPRGVGPRY